VADTVSPLATVDDFTLGAFADLVSSYPAPALEAALAEATRIAEEEAGSRLAPFTGLTETVRVAAMPPDERSGVQVPGHRVPVFPPPGFDPVLNNQIRHFWLPQRPLRYPDMWTYDVTAIVTSGPYSYAITDITDGPDDEGHMWVQPGQYLATGSRVRVTYSGGYTVAVPASLVRVGKLLAAEIIIRELDPDDAPTSHDPDLLHEDALMILTNWPKVDT
jgi:hypothetical protein